MAKVSVTPPVKLMVPRNWGGKGIGASGKSKTAYRPAGICGYLYVNDMSKIVYPITSYGRKRGGTGDTGPNQRAWTAACY